MVKLIASLNRISMYKLTVNILPIVYCTTNPRHYNFICNSLDLRHDVGYYCTLKTFDGDKRDRTIVI